MVVSFWVTTSESFFSNAPFWNGFPERHATARCSATAPHPPRTHIGLIGERTGPNAKLELDKRERGKERPRSPIWWGILKTWKTQYDTAQQTAVHQFPLLYMNVLKYCCSCCASVLGGWVGRWVVCCTCCCCSATAVAPRPPHTESQGLRRNNRPQQNTRSAIETSVERSRPRSPTGGS